jgi:hypothetical protein
MTVAVLQGLSAVEHVDRRKENLRMQLDRRKSDLDVIEHIVLGVRRATISAPRDHARAHPRPKK